MLSGLKAFTSTPYLPTAVESTENLRKRDKPEDISVSHQPDDVDWKYRAANVCLPVRDGAVLGGCKHGDPTTVRRIDTSSQSFFVSNCGD